MKHSQTNKLKASFVKDITNPIIHRLNPSLEKISREFRRTTNLFELFYNRFLLLDRQYERVNYTLRFFNWNYHIGFYELLEKLINALPTTESVDSLEQKMSLLLTQRDTYKMRVLAAADGTVKVEAHLLSVEKPIYNSTSDYFIKRFLSPWSPKPTSESWDVFINDKPTKVSPFTSFKTTNRKHYTQARDFMNVVSTSFKSKISTNRKSEVLIYNDKKQLMEGSITNVAIKRKTDGVYVTPPLTSGCLYGTMRSYLLSAGLIEEEDINIESLRNGEDIILFNGVMGCVEGTIRRTDF